MGGGGVWGAVTRGQGESAFAVVGGGKWRRGRAGAEGEGPEGESPPALTPPGARALPRAPPSLLFFPPAAPRRHDLARTPSSAAHSHLAHAPSLAHPAPPPGLPRLRRRRTLGSSLQLF